MTEEQNEILQMWDALRIEHPDVKNHDITMMVVGAIQTATPADVIQALIDRINDQNRMLGSSDADRP